MQFSRKYGLGGEDHFSTCCRKTRDKSRFFSCSTLKLWHEKLIRNFHIEQSFSNVCSTLFWQCYQNCGDIQPPHIWQRWCFQQKLIRIRFEIVNKKLKQVNNATLNIYFIFLRSIFFKLSRVCQKYFCDLSDISIFNIQHLVQCPSLSRILIVKVIDDRSLKFIKKKNHKNGIIVAEG